LPLLTSTLLPCPTRFRSERQPQALECGPQAHAVVAPGRIGDRETPAHLLEQDDRAVWREAPSRRLGVMRAGRAARLSDELELERSEEHTSELQSPDTLVC